MLVDALMLYCIYCIGPEQALEIAILELLEVSHGIASLIIDVWCHRR
jgi:hypothetical protein